MAFAETAPLIAQLDLKGNFTSSLKKAQGALGQFSGSLGRAGRGAGQLGSGFARVGTILGTAVVGGLVGAAKAAIDFEDAFAGVRKTVDEADLKAAGLSFESLAKQFRGMATEIPIAATEFARIGEAAGALGVKAGDLETFTRTVALLGVTTDLTADAAADSLGRIGTILNFTGKDYVAFADAIVNLGNKGASTESEIIEISKRFAGAGRQAGLATTEIAGLASITAALGFGPERGGTALARVFANMGTNIALANSKGKAFAAVVGKPVKTLIEDLRRGDALGVFRDFLVGLRDLDRIEATVALKNAGIKNTSDRQIFVDMAANIDKVDQSLLDAKDSVGALSVEATKRFNTIASKLTLLKNNFIEAGITIGEGFLPALGRTTEKLIAFLKVDANKSALKGIGEDIGKALDSINWDEVLSGARQLATLLKGALGIAKTLYDSFMLLPGPVKEAAAGFLVLNKLSGGLIGAGAGNLIGGLAATAIRAGGSRLGGAVGAAFAQPVFVTNWAMMAGGGLGGVGAAGAAGLAGKIASLIPVGIFATALIAAAVPLGEAFAAALPPELKGPGGRGESESQRRIREGREAMERNNPRPVQPAAGADRRDPQATRPIRPSFVDSPRTSPASLAALEAAMARGRAAGFKPTLAAAQATNQKNLERLAAAQLVKSDAIKNAIQAGDTRSELAGIRSAVASQSRALPVTNVKVEVNVTAAAVNKSVTIQKRYGPSGGSRDQGQGSAGWTGGR